MNIQVLFDIMSDRANYHAAVAETVPCKLWANSSDMFSAVVANSNKSSQARMLADKFKNNRNEMLYDYTPNAGVAADIKLTGKKKRVMTNLFSKATNTMVTMPTCQSFASNVSNAVMHTKDNVLSIQYQKTDEYRFEDVPEEYAVIALVEKDAKVQSDKVKNDKTQEDSVDNNIIQFVPRHMRSAS